MIKAGIPEQSLSYIGLKIFGYMSLLEIPMFKLGLNTVDCTYVLMR